MNAQVFAKFCVPITLDYRTISVRVSWRFLAIHACACVLATFLHLQGLVLARRR